MTRPVSLLSTRTVIDLSTEPQFIGWSAIDANTYDADCDQDGYFTTSPHGTGSTESEAIDALFDALEGE